MRFLKIAGGVLLAGVFLYVAHGLLVRPSNDREWMPEQAVLPRATIEGDVARVTGIRDWRWDPETPGWYDAEYDLSKVASAWYLVVPFKDVKGGAHTFLSFGFEDGRHLAVSVEARKEKGETYSPLKGVLRSYEVMYVVADERDVIGLRAGVWNDDVFLFPVRTTKEKMRAALADVLQRANQVAERPEFYDTFRNSCMSNVVRHVNHVTPDKVPLSPRTWFPAMSDSLAYDLGLLDVEGSLEDARKRWRVTDRAKAAFALALDSREFSARIRAAD